MAQDNFYSDIDMALTRDRDGDITKDVDEQAIINSLTNIVSTMQGSRRMIPEAFQDINALLFDPLDEELARIIGERLLEAIVTWEDRVEISKVDIAPNFDANRYDIRMTFYIKSVNREQSLDFVLFAG